MKFLVITDNMHVLLKEKYLTGWGVITEALLFMSTCLWESTRIYRSINFFQLKQKTKARQRRVLDDF